MNADYVKQWLLKASNDLTEAKAAYKLALTIEKFVLEKLDIC